MARSKVIEVAMADLKMALQLKYVKFGLLGMGALGPIMVTGMIVILSIAVPPAELAFVLPLLTPVASTVLAMFAIIPAGMISANALVGEKEQRTLEPLLATPLTDRELLLGKTLSSFIPCMILLTGGTVVTMVAINVILLTLGASPILIPDLPGLFLIFAAGPPVILSVVSIMILISGRVSRVYEAYQASGGIIMVFMIPMIVPMMNFGGGGDYNATVWLTNIVVFFIGIVLMSVTWALALRRFNRDTMVSMK
ncbi:MAG: ABC transporter permease subunit [Candidatus Thorarchaeota archaeon]|jgi:ABC-2 type transport system permease protein